MVNKPINHIAIIPDGNRRWAKEHGLPTFEGHRQGYQKAILLGRKARELGIPVLTFWAFSTENWQRKKEEVSYLMGLFETLIDENLKEALREKIRIIHIGRKDRISKKLLEKIIQAEEETKNFKKNYLVIGLDYGGRDEILRAVTKAVKENKSPLSEEEFSKLLDTKDLPYPNPDLIIRTSGELRTSGYLLWQSEYAEWIFVKKKFPDFGPEDLEKCVDEYYHRQRRFGQ